MEVIIDGYIGFSRHDLGADGRRNGFEMHPQTIYPGIFEFLEPGKIIRGFALGLNREIDLLFNGLGAFSEVGGTAIGCIGSTTSTERLK